jgi:DNA polymerase III subunit gamma/tau
MTDGSLFNLNAYQSEDMPVESVPEPDPASGAVVSPSVARNDAGPKSLYRKYRPQSFAEDDLFGQEHIVNTLRNAIVLDRIAHAYLFCGPRGTGKTTTARLLAKAVNCLDPDPRNRPCNQCDACVAINTGATTDVIEIDAASNRGIDDIRDLRERVKYAPSQLKTKFYIIDEAHQITGAAANAFLKTLEEPPAHTKFVLATTDPEELLQTIVSRCQRFDFRRIGLEAMTACLTKVAAAENIEIDEEAKSAIARHATGSMRDALGLLDQVAVYRENADDSGTQVTVDLVRTVLGISRNERVEDIVRALADKDAGAGLRAVGQAVEAGDDIRQLTRQLVAYLRLLLLARAGGDADIDEAGKELAGRFELRELAELARLMGDIDFKVKHATISQLPLEIAIVDGALRDQAAVAPGAPAGRPASAAPEPSVAQSAPTAASPTPSQGRGSLRDRVRGGGRPTPSPMSPDSGPQTRQQAPASSPTPTPPQEPARPTHVAPARSAPSSMSAAPVDGFHLEAMVDAWPRIRADVKAVNRRIEALLQQIDPVAIVGSKVTLVTPYEFHRNRVNTDEVRLVIEEVIGRIFSEKVTVTCVTKDEAAALPTSRTAPRPIAEPVAAYQSDPAPAASPSMAETPAHEPAQAPSAASDPVPARSYEDDERTFQAVKNIFDAEEEDL